MKLQIHCETKSETVSSGIKTRLLSKHFYFGCANSSPLSPFLNGNPIAFLSRTVG
jgi:hypothetical protein|eukprot:COSAG06_NODE_103_length_23904_cov_10.413401_34_plen_55_part_00